MLTDCFLDNYNLVNRRGTFHFLHNIKDFISSTELEPKWTPTLAFLSPVVSTCSRRRAVGSFAYWAIVAGLPSATTNAVRSQIRSQTQGGGKCSILPKSDLFNLLKLGYRDVSTTDCPFHHCLRSPVSDLFCHPIQDDGLMASYTNLNYSLPKNLESFEYKSS